MQTKMKIFLAALAAATSLTIASSAIAQPPGGMGAGPDFSEAAETLGITEDELRTALGGPPPNFEQAAETLGISEEELAEALPPPPEGGRGQ